MSLNLDTIETVIDNLRDSQSLKACALVSHALLIPARRKLFAFIHLTTGGHCRRFWELLQQSPHLIVYPRCLSIYIHDWAGHQEDPVFTHHVTLNSIIVTISPYLQKFYLHSRIGGPRLSFRVIPDLLRATLLQLFPSPGLVTLGISGFHDLPLRTLASRRHIRRLMTGHGCSTSEHNPVDFISPAEKVCLLESLEAHCGRCATFISHSFVLSALADLWVGEAVPFETVCTLLQESQDSLQIFDWTSYPVKSSTFSKMGAIHLPNLKYLVVHVCEATSGLGNLDFLASVLDDESSTAAHALEEIHLNLMLRDNFSDIATDSSWGSLAVALTKTRYPKLSNISFCMTSRDGQGLAAEAADSFWQQVSPLLSSGVFEVFFDGTRIKPVEPIVA